MSLLAFQYVYFDRKMLTLTKLGFAKENDQKVDVYQFLCSYITSDYVWIPTIQKKKITYKDT